MSNILRKENYMFVYVKHKITQHKSDDYTRIYYTYIVYLIKLIKTICYRIKIYACYLYDNIT